MPDALEKALRDLEAAREVQFSRVEKEQTELARIDQAIHQIRATLQRVDPARLHQHDFAELKITAAAEILLEEKGEMSTPELAAEMKARGLQSAAKRLVPAIYATLANSPKFVRTGSSWRLAAKKVGV